MSHDRDAICVCATEHRPAPLEYERHHVWPLYLGGPDIEDNTIWVCPTTHTNVHEILREFMRVGPLTWGEALAAWDRPLSRYAFHLAWAGYARWAATERNPQ